VTESGRKEPFQEVNRMSEEKNRPVVKVRHGRFQVTLWQSTRRVRARAHYQAEREFDVERICIQRSTFNRNTGKYKNQQIWLDPHEIRDLALAMDEFEEAQLECEH
jgi:hypothetical protein